MSKRDRAPHDANPLQKLSLQRALACAKDGLRKEALEWLSRAGSSAQVRALEAELRYGLASELAADEDWAEALKELARVPRDAGVSNYFIEERQRLIRRREAALRDTEDLQERFRTGCPRCAGKDLYSVATCSHQVAPIQPSVRLNPGFLAPIITAVYAAGAYRSGWDRAKNDALSMLVRHEKDRIDERVLRLLGVVLGEYIRHRTPLLKHIDLIVPVPTSRDRAAARGGSIPYSFAVTLQDVLAVPMRASLQLVGEYDGHSVVSGAARSQALERAWRAEQSNVLKGTSVLLVDDIVTRGTTLTVAAELMRKAGAREVYAVALLHTEKSM